MWWKIAAILVALSIILAIIYFINKEEAVKIASILSIVIAASSFLFSVYTTEAKHTNSNTVLANSQGDKKQSSGQDKSESAEAESIYDTNVFAESGKETQIKSGAIYLKDLDYYNSSDTSGAAFKYYDTVRDNLGTTYGNGIGGAGQWENWQEYKLAGNYKEIVGRIVVNYDYRSKQYDDVMVKVYGDGAMLYASPIMKAGQEPVDFVVDITGVDILRVSIVEDRVVRLVDCILYDTVGNKEREYQEEVKKGSIRLQDMDYLASSDSSGSAFKNYETVKDNLGITYGNGIGGAGQGDNWQEYKLSGTYKEIIGRVVLNYDHRSKQYDDTLLKIYGDNTMLYASPVMKAGQEPDDFAIDIAGVDILKVSIVGNNTVRLVDCILYDTEGNGGKLYQEKQQVKSSVYLQELDYLASSNSSGNAFNYYETVKDNLGLVYGNGIGGRSQGESWQDYKLSGNYKEIIGRVVLNYDSRSQQNSNIIMKIYSDDVLLYTSPEMKAGQDPVDFKLDITNTDILRVTVEGEKMLRLVDCVLYTTTDNEYKNYTYSLPDKDRIYLYELDYFSSSDSSHEAFIKHSNVKDNMENTYVDGIGGRNGYENWQEYKIYSIYNQIQGKIVLNYDYRDKKGDETYVKIYGDDQLLYTSPLITSGQEPVDFNVNINGVNTLRVSLGGQNLIRIVDCYLTK